MGGSYGGYMTFAAMTDLPGRFRAGVSFVGVSNWISALEGASPALKASDRLEYGDIDDPFTRISPSKVNRFRVRINSRPTMGFILGGHYTYRKVENTLSDFDFKQSGFGVHTTYTGTQGNFFQFLYLPIFY